MSQAADASVMYPAYAVVFNAADVAVLKAADTVVMKPAEGLGLSLDGFRTLLS